MSLALALQRIGERELAKYSPDQPRDDHGRWTSGGGGGSLGGRGLFRFMGEEAGGGGDIASKHWKDLNRNEKETRMADAFMSELARSQSGGSQDDRDRAARRVREWDRLSKNPGDRGQLFGEIAQWHERERQRLNAQLTSPEGQAYYHRPVPGEPPRKTQQDYRSESQRIQDANEQRNAGQRFADRVFGRTTGIVSEDMTPEERRAGLEAIGLYRERMQHRGFLGNLGQRTRAMNDPGLLAAAGNWGGRVGRAGVLVHSVAQSLRGAYHAGSRLDLNELGRHLTNAREDLGYLREEIRHLPRETRALAPATRQTLTHVRTQAATARTKLRSRKK